MKEPDIPQNEERRLKTLISLNILDTPSEERFDRLTRMAKRIFNVPIALVSIVDKNRQWFKSCIGLSVTETPRNISFCGHAIGDKLLITFAEHISNICRESDILARLGGDEFVILFIDTPKHSAINVIKRLKNSLSKYNHDENNEYDISFSYGVVDFIPEKHKSIDALLEEADSRMYEFKHSNK